VLYELRSQHGTILLHAIMIPSAILIYVLLLQSMTVYFYHVS
jgi:hypothetical protein